jgi:radical SAM superfamily enzyme YgiQ (UPF0313 family)
MNVLLIYPEFPDTFWSFKHALSFVRKKASLPPLGLLTVAALLPEHWGKRLVDINVRPLTRKDLAWADVAFVGAMTIQRESARQAIARCKAAGLTVVAGGPLFIGEQEAFGDVDHFVLNEAELTLPEFLRDLTAGRARRTYETSEFADIRESPVPMWSLLDLRRYATMAVQFSRGCPYDCDFCNVTVLLGHRPRLKTAAQIVRELDALYALGWRESVFFVDDNLIGNKRLLKEDLLPALIRWRRGKTGMTFHTEASINLADDEAMLQLMADAGFNMVFIGIETPDEASLSECGKKHNKNRDLIADVKRIQRHGMQVQGGFIIGFDNDSPSIFARQIEFIQRSGIVTAMVGLLQAPLGTRLYQRLAAEGRLIRAFSGDNVDGMTNIITRMPIKVLQDGYRRVIHSLYAPANYYARVKTFLAEFKPPRFEVPLDFEHVLALFRSIFRLGIIGRERREYWRFFFWALFRKPRLFPLAITFTIYGFHFRRVIDLHVQ